MTQKFPRSAHIEGTIRRAGAALTLAGALILAGCNTTESGPKPSSVSAASTPGVVHLKGEVKIEKGMSKDEIVAQLGQPANIEPIVRENVAGEIWTYKIERTVSSTIESDGEQERVYADEETGQFVTVREPIFRNEKINALTTTQLLFIGDTLVAFKDETQGGILEVGHK